MVAPGTRQTRGRIVVVQEQRFRLATDEGVNLLLTLARSASVDQAQLCRFRDLGTPVVVAYRGQPNLASGVALKVSA